MRSALLKLCRASCWAILSWRRVARKDSTKSWTLSFSWVRFRAVLDHRLEIDVSALEWITDQFRDYNLRIFCFLFYPSLSSCFQIPKLFSVLRVAIEAAPVFLSSSSLCFLQSSFMRLPCLAVLEELCSKFTLAWRRRCPWSRVRRPKLEVRLFVPPLPRDPAFVGQRPKQEVSSEAAAQSSKVDW